MRKPYLFEASLAILLVVLIAFMFIAIASSSPSVSGWELGGSGRVHYMTVGDNDTLYAFKSDGIYAIDQKGNLIWDLQVPGHWKILNSWERPVYATDKSGVSRTVESYPVTDASAGYLYVFALPDVALEDLKIQYYQSQSPYLYVDAAVLAISPQGQLAWERPLKIKVNSNDIIGLADMKDFKMTRMVALRSDGDRIYVFHDYTETVIDRNGTMLFNLNNVAQPASIDERGNIYVVRAVKPTAGSGALRPGEKPYNPEIDPEYMVPSSVIESYDANGNLVWDRDIHGTVASQYIAEDIWPKFNCLPMYQNGTLYVPLTNGIVALDQMGRTLWWKYITGGTFAMFELMPIDSQGNVYMKELNPASSSSYLYVIGPDGWIHSSPWIYTSKYDALRHTAASEGIVYNIDKREFGTIKNVYSLDTDTITAYSVKNGSALWSYTLPVNNKHVVVLNESNVGDLIREQYYVDKGWVGPVLDRDPGSSSPSLVDRSLSKTVFTPIGWPEVSIYPGTEVVYVSFQSINYEYPIVYNKSRAVFSSGIYALNNDGRLVWEKPLSALVTSTAANNSTIYYSTADGKIFGTTVNTVVAGFTIAAVAAIFLKFFVFGTVSRARDRLDKNDNRNMVHSYIAANPGVTAVDIARDLHLNVGTVRYHLLILAINHRIVEHKDDKYLRYFTNSNSFSLEERSVVSLMKREPMWRVLNALAEKPGLSNVEISRELNISTGAASRHMSELLAKGIVDKVPQSDRGYAYSIRDEYKEHVVRTMERL